LLCLCSQYDWGAIYQLQDVDNALEYLTTGIGSALDRVAPVKIVTILKGKCLYLARDTLDLMKLCDVDKGSRYCKLRNRGLVLVEKDKRRSNESKLNKSHNDPRVLW
jgi:hypothetical protein